MHSFLFCTFVCFSEVPCVFYQIRKKCMNLYTQNMIVRYFTRFKWIWFLYKCTLIVEWLTFKIKGAFLEFKTTNVFQHRRTCVCLFVRLFSSRSRMFLLIVRRHNYRWRGLRLKWYKWGPKRTSPAYWAVVFIMKKFQQNNHFEHSFAKNDPKSF